MVEIESPDGTLIARLTRDEQGAGVTLDLYTAWTTTTAIVVDRQGRERCRAVRTWSESSSASGVSESGDTIDRVEFSMDGRQLVLHISDGTTEYVEIPDE